MTQISVMRFYLTIILSLSVLFATAQESKRKRNQRNSRKNEELVDFSGRYRLKGWHFAPGVDYTLTRFKNEEETLIDRNDTLYNATFDPNGKFGLYFEVGRYHLFKYGVLFNYMDYSLAYKAIKGTESYTGTMMTESTSSILANTSGDADFKHKYLLGNINFNNIIPLGSYSFLQNSLGFNIDFRFSDKRNNHTNTFGQTQADPSRLLAQLHYKIGFGYKLNEKIFLIPSLETPILNIFQWDKFKSTDPMFSSRYRPIIFTLRIAWLSKSKPGDCPPVYGSPDDKAKQKAYEMEK
jgi:hypothetical protein